MRSKWINIQGIGDILLERSTRAKHINLSVKPFAGVRVAIPSGVTFQKALEFAHKKAGWIKKHLDRMALVERKAIELEQMGPINRPWARKLLVRRLDELASIHGFAYNKAFIRNQRTRWGSCSQKNNINLNINLVRLPQTLIDYTILHELVHTQVKNHSRQFWNELGRYIENPKKVDRELTQYWVMLIRRQ